MNVVGCKVLHFINNEDWEALDYKTLWCTNIVTSHREDKALGLCIRSMTVFKISLIYVQGCEKRNSKQIHQHGSKFKFGISEFVKLHRSSQCQACSINLDKCHLSSFSKTTFLHLFLGSIFISLIQPLVMYQTQLRSTQITSQMHFDKRLANYI